MSAEAPQTGDILRIRDERWRVTRLISHGSASIVEVLGTDRLNRGIRTRFLLPFELFERLPKSQEIRIVRPNRWRRLARGVLANAQPSYEALRCTTAADISILPFQLEPALAVTRGLAARILVADDVGLGKTIQAGLVVAELVARIDEPHVLIVVPSGLRNQWCDELRSRFHLTPVVGDAASLTRGVTYCPPSENPWALHPIVVTSIDFIKRAEVIRALETLVWDLVVFDEAHLLSTRSDRNSAASALAERARTVLMLTATPHSGDDDEFNRICDLGNLAGDFPLLMFRRTRSEIGLPDSRRTTWLKVRPTRAELRMHDAVLRYGRQVWREKGAVSGEARLAATVLARRASSSASSLTRSVERRLALLEEVPQPEPRQLVLTLEDEEPDAEIGAAGLHDAEEERLQLTDLLTLALAAQDRESKIGAIGRILRRVNEPVIVFTEFRDTLNRLKSELADHSLAILHGGLTAGERQEALHEFTSGKTRILLATDAASEGLNLHQRCRLVVNLELPWTPRRREQRVGRVHRLGQQRRVHEIHLLAAQSFEETVLVSLSRRTDRINNVLATLRPKAVHADDVASTILGDETRVAPLEPVATPNGFFTTDLVHDAVQESARITLCRSLNHGSVPSDNRPFACHARRRTDVARAYWAVRISFTDIESAILWERVLAFEAELTHTLPRQRAAVRELAKRLFREGVADVDSEHRSRLIEFLAGLRKPVTCAIDRERAILAAAEGRSARMAATLLQRSLFDHRTERKASEQAAALDELRQRCQRRLEWLERHQRAVIGSQEPIFAVIKAR